MTLKVNFFLIVAVERLKISKYSQETPTPVLQSLFK